MPRVSARALIAVAALIVAALVARPSGQPAAMRVLVLVDMEGVAGTVTADQLGPAGFEYGRFREFMTREALAAVTAARSAGATEWWSATRTVTARTCSSSNFRRMFGSCDRGRASSGWSRRSTPRSTP